MKQLFCVFQLYVEPSGSGKRTRVRILCGSVKTLGKVFLSTLLLMCIHKYLSIKKLKVRSYIAQYPILRIAQNAVHITSLADLFNQTPSQLLWEASSHTLQLMREGCSYTYPPLVYSQVLIYTAEWTGAMQSEKTCPRL